MPCIPHPLREDQQTRCEGGPSTGIPDTQGEQYRWSYCFFIARVTEIGTCVESGGVLLLGSPGSLHDLGFDLPCEQKKKYIYIYIYLNI